MKLNRIGLPLGALGALVALAVSSPLSASAQAPPPATVLDVAPARPYSITVRGGVSLGSYEAGLNWALVRLLKNDPKRRADLVTVTGASAGNVNAFLTALEWCEDAAHRDGETPTDNLFWQSWVSVGIDTLFPRHEKHGYSEGDGLFTRNAFAGPERAFFSALRDPSRFRTPCALSLGVSVTRIRPSVMTLRAAGGTGAAADGIPIETQRFVAAFQTERTTAGLVFRPVEKDDHEIGEYLHLPMLKGYLETEQLRALIHASSAFPMAFGPQTIEHCDDDDEARPPDCLSPVADKFIDGGIFDNVPLGLAVSLSQHVLAPEAAKAMSYFYIDPGHLRGYAPRPLPAAERPETRSVGLSNTLDFVSKFLEVSQQYELQAEARYLFKSADDGGAGAVPAPRLSSRLHPLFGSFFGHFGAFFAKPFREHDFFVGIYDALADGAREECGIAATRQPMTEAQATCFAASVRRGHDAAGLDAPKAAASSYVVRRLLDDELRRGVPAGVLPKVLAGDGSAGALDKWLEARKTLKDQDGRADRVVLMRVLLDVLLCGAEAGVTPPGCPAPAGSWVEDQDFTVLIERLDDTLALDGLRRETYFVPPDERELLRDPNRWLANARIDAAERLDQIEHIDQYPLGEHVTALAQMVLETEPFRPITAWDLDPSTIPDRRFTAFRGLFHLLPYEVSGDFVHGGWDIAWRPTFSLGPHWLGLVLPVSPWTWRRTTHETLQSAGVGLLFAFDAATVTGVEAFPKIQCQWFAKCAVGAEVGAFLLAGKIRVGLGLDRFDDLHADAITVRLGLSDANGLLYWLSRHAVQ